MASNKLKISLIIVGIISLCLFGFSFLSVSTTPPIKESFPVEQNFSGESQGLTFISIDFGGGRRKVIEVKPNNEESLFNIMKESLSKDGIELSYETYTGLGEFITQIDNAKNGTDGKYWQFWVNGAYSQVGASSYIPKNGDMIEWKFTGQME